MKLKLDENLPESLADVLGELGHDVDTVPREGLTGRGDPDVWRAAQESGRLLITQDMDFSDIRAFDPGTHHGILLVRLRVSTWRLLIDRVRTLVETEEVESWRGCFVVASDHKLRVRRPNGKP